MNLTQTVPTRSPQGLCSSPYYFEAINYDGAHFYCHPNLWAGHITWGEARVFFIIDLYNEYFWNYPQVNYVNLNLYMQTYSGGEANYIIECKNKGSLSYSFNESGFETAYVPPTGNFLLGWNTLTLNNVARKYVRGYLNGVSGYHRYLVFRIRNLSMSVRDYFHQNNPPTLTVNFDVYNGNIEYLKTLDKSKINYDGNGLCYNQNVQCNHEGIFEIKSVSGPKHNGVQILSQNRTCNMKSSNPCGWQSDYDSDIRRQCNCTLYENSSDHLRTNDNNILLEGTRVRLDV